MPQREASAEWWADRRYWALLIALSALPLLWPPLPPLTDALGHLGRYHIETALAHSPALQRYYDFHWALMGNLGIDLLIVPMTAVFGVEVAAKLIVLAIPVTMAFGLWAVAVQIHGRPTAFTAAALPLAYGYPLQFGFLNYWLAMGLALIAFAGWLKLGAAGRTRLRAGLFVGIGLALWLCHAFGWAVLGVLVFCAETMARRDRGRSWPAAASGAGMTVLPLVPPALLMLVWRSGDVGGGTGVWFNLGAKLGWLASMLRDRWEMFDRLSAGLVGFTLLAGLIERRIGYERRLGAAALLLFVLFLCLPFILLGSAYADMRLAPFAAAVGLIALKEPVDRRWARVIALVACAFFAARTIATTISFLGYDRAYQRHLNALDRIPYGARVLIFAGAPCADDWTDRRMEHLGALATVRRDAFVNTQWTLRGAQLVSVHYPAAGRFQNDPSQFIRSRGCRSSTAPVTDQQIPQFPMAAFDYLWIIDLPGVAAIRRPGLQLIWAQPDGALFRIVPASAVASPPPPAPGPALANR